VTRANRKIHFDTEREQRIEQRWSYRKSWVTDGVWRQRFELAI
jgi:hypothetical protein